MLLDTHVWLWLQVSPERLLPEVLDQLRTEDTLYLSVASVWEIVIKWQIGKLDLPQPPLEYVPERLRRQSISPLSITSGHALGVSELPRHHRDPFDRLLVAQARLEDLRIVTSDAALEAYDVALIPAV